MLKADLTRLTSLASDDETVRIGAAAQLTALQPYHFHDHPIDTERLPAGWVDAVAAAWHATSNDTVRAWIAQAVALAQPWHSKPVEPLMLHFLDIAGPYLSDVVSFVIGFASGMPGAKERLLALHRHRDPRVRSAMAGGLMSKAAAYGLGHATDAPIVRQLMLDPDRFVRNYAVGIAEKFDELDRVDVEVLLDVVNIDCDGARIRAQRLIQSLAAKRPDCSPDSFAPRVPLLRTDGLYHSLVTEFDGAGRWMTSRCLRFFPDGSVHAFGIDESSVNFQDVMPHRAHPFERGLARQAGADVSFTIESTEGTVDYVGRIDGSQIHSVRVDRATGRETAAAYEYDFVDWNASPPSPALATPPGKRRGKAAVPLPFEPPRQQSLTVVDATQWYLWMVARLPIFIDAVAGDEERFERAWLLKNEMRKAAAQALLVPELKSTLFEALPLPDATEVLRAVPDGSPNPHAGALRALTTITLAERRAFGTDGEAVGSSYRGAEGVYVMTDQGWQRASTAAPPAGP